MYFSGLVKMTNEYLHRSRAIGKDISKTYNKLEKLALRKYQKSLETNKTMHL
jgi:hypothetical protein